MYESRALTREQLQQSINAFDPRKEVTLALVDMDHFDHVNSHYGTDSGDQVLETLEKLLLQSLPEGSLVARVGGDEFALALPDHSPESTLILLSEIQAHFLGYSDLLTPKFKLTFSAGIASKPAHARDFPSLLQAADEALYRIKTEKRGSIGIYVEAKMVLKSNYYPKASLERLSRIANAQKRTEASLLREALETLLTRYSDQV